jgi:hypothetical protein
MERVKRTGVAVAVGLTVVAGAGVVSVLAGTSGTGVAVPVPTFTAGPIAPAPVLRPELVIAQVARAEPPPYVVPRPVARAVGTVGATSRPRIAPPAPAVEPKPAPRTPAKADAPKKADAPTKRSDRPGKAKGRARTKRSG